MARPARSSAIIRTVDRPVPRCSFCGKKQGDVRLVAGPSDVYICNLCVALCNEILAHDDLPSGLSTPGPLDSGLSTPGPREPERGPLIVTEVTSG